MKTPAELKILQKKYWAGTLVALSFVFCSILNKLPLTA